MPLGPAQGYLAKFNGYALPGYVQSESFDSVMRIADNYAAYADGGRSEYTGLQNKMISLTLKVWEQDYATCKQQVRQAATILRSERGYAQLQLQNTDTYYSALVSSIKMEKTAGDSVRLLEYQVEFNCKPWLYSANTYTISGNGLNGAQTTISTVGRTIDDGGWTATTVRLSGRNVTISGWTQNGDFAGFISVSGYIADMSVDSEGFTATTSGGLVNQNRIMNYADYRMYVGPEVTYFTISGAQKCEITWNNRWYI